MRPLGNKVLIERVAAEKLSSGGILLQRSDGPDKAKILAVGPEAKEVAVGEVALVNWNAAVKTTGEQYVIGEDHIIFVYEEE
jgi:co-chaperonin GroES (HSP10)